MDFQAAVELAGLAVDGAGVVAIVAGIALAGARYVRHRRSVTEPYRALRHDIGRAILLGLELLVAADIIRTVAISPTLENVAILGGIVLIRTFLSMALQVELEGRLPWKAAR